MKKKILEFDILRSIAVVWIIAVWHFSNYYSSTSSFGQIVNNNICRDVTYIMLSLFMLLSGVLTNSCNIAGKESIKAYYLKKIKRFYPLYVIAAITLFFTTIPSFVSFYSGYQQLFLSLFGMASLYKQAPSTLWFMDMLLLFIMVTPLLVYKYKTHSFFRIILMVFLYGMFFVLSKKTNIVDTRFIRYMPFYMIGLLLTPAKFLDLANKYGWVAFILAILIRLLPFHHLFSEMLGYCLIIFWGGKMALLYCKYLNSPIVGNIISFISYSSMCAYFFHRQLYAMGILIGLPLFLLPIIVFLLSYCVQKTYDSIMKLI